MVSGCKYYDDCFSCPFDECRLIELKKQTYDPEYHRAYYKEHKERLRAYQKEYRRKHPQMQIEANRRWVEKNRDHKNALQREYYRRKKGTYMNERI